MADHTHDHGAGKVDARPASSAADTIVAIATPPGRGGIGIVRASGPMVPTLARTLLGRLPAPRYATYAVFRDGEGVAIDHGVALFFPAPQSFTGEDVLELQGHGGPLVMDMLLRCVVALGARLARPGEFSERAFLNGKLDLAQAEAVADLIEASSESAARSALRSLEGKFSEQVRQIVDTLITLRTYVEASIDFAEEEIDFVSNARVERELVSILDALATLLEAARQGCLLHDGMTVVLAGPPNAGKSSLLNSLAQQDTAIVSAIPGTTRDVLRERIVIDGMPVHVLDTAGLRDSTDEIESEGVRRAHVAMQRADRVLLVMDDTVNKGVSVARLLRQIAPGRPYTLIHNKIDLTGRPPGLHRGTGAPEVALSARSGAGLDALRAHLKACMGFQIAGEGSFIARRRHLDAIERARTHVQQAQQQLLGPPAGELMAEELRLAQRALGEITGEFTSEDLLARIFASFCIGK